MTRILLRTPKGPFDGRSAEATLARNLVASNSGNLLFLGATSKLLSVPGVDLDPDRLRVRARDADAINERYDAYVVPLANAFRPGFEDTLVRMTRLIRRLRIPVTVLGVGAQAPVDGELASLAPMKRAVQGFVAAVLDRSPAIGVRGEVTADYLARLGFRDVEVIGCPSMFLWGPSLPVSARVSELDASSRVAITISTYRSAMGRIALETLARYPHLAYIAQDIETLGLLVDGTPLPGGTPDDPLPMHPDHPLFREDRARYYLDPWTWIRDLRAMDFVFGSRIHGTIAGLLAGTRSVLLAHDSRTLELARHFEIPHRLLRDMPRTLDPAWLDREADFGPMHAGHAARFAAFTAYLERCGIDHVFAHPGAAEAFDARVAATHYPPAVRAGYAHRPWFDRGRATRRVRAWVRTQGGRREMRGARVRVRALVG